jgi:dTDP-4-dehydrorhamnose reductase
MNILIIGASGLVGGNCLRYFSSKKELNCAGTYFGFEVENLHYYNTLEPQHFNNYNISQFKPEVIVHCGALTHVDYCEKNSEESYQKTVQSTINVTALCKAFNAKMVYLSTDYVFDGTKGFYAETDELNPLSIYAKHKLEAEKIVQAELANHLIVRITNVYGDEIRGKNFVARLVSQLMAGQQINLQLPYDQYATPINALDVAKAIYLLIRDNKRGIYHLGSTDYLNRVQLAYKVAQMFDTDTLSVEAVSTAQLNQDAKRPLLGGFNTAKFMAEYPTFQFSSVDQYLYTIKSKK